MFILIFLSFIAGCFECCTGVSALKQISLKQGPAVIVFHTMYSILYMVCWQLTGKDQGLPVVLPQHYSYEKLCCVAIVYFSFLNLYF